LGTTQQLDSLADRVMYRLAYRNFGDHESLVVTHSVAPTAGGGGVRWYEIRNPGGVATVFQQSTYAPDTKYRCMASAARDQVGKLPVRPTTGADRDLRVTRQRLDGRCERRLDQWSEFRRHRRQLRRHRHVRRRGSHECDARECLEAHGDNASGSGGYCGRNG